MLLFEVFVRKFTTIDGFSSCSIELLNREGGGGGGGGEKGGGGSVRSEILGGGEKGERN